MKQKHVDKTLSSVVFLADFHICDSHRIWGFISGANSFKIIFLGNKSVCVILLKVSKADCVQISVFALVLPRDIFL